MGSEKQDLIRDEIQLTPVAFNFLVDEVEMPKTDITNLTFYYFGLLVPAEKSHLLEDSVNKLVAILYGKKFHAHRTYKSIEHQEICHKINELILNYNLEIICFPFVKNWLENSRLEVLRNFHLKEMKKVKFSNYRSQAWLLFIHVLNSFFISRYPSHRIRIFFDHDWLDTNEMIVHKGEKLAALAEIISTTAKKTPMLILADHVGYMFQVFKKVSTISDGQIVINNLKDGSDIKKAAINLFKNITLKRSFHTLDLWTWIDKENERSDTIAK